MAEHLYRTGRGSEEIVQDLGRGGFNLGKRGVWQFRKRHQAQASTAGFVDAMQFIQGQGTDIRRAQAGAGQLGFQSKMMELQRQQGMMRDIGRGAMLADSIYDYYNQDEAQQTAQQFGFNDKEDLYKRWESSGSLVRPHRQTGGYSLR